MRKRKCLPLRHKKRRNPYKKKAKKKTKRLKDKGLIIYIINANSKTFRIYLQTL